MALISGMSDVRVVITFVTIGGCLLILYPKVFAPLLFGARKDKAIQNNPSKMHHQKAPPRGPGSDEPNQPPVGLPPNMDAEIQRHMRGGPHPGMRHAAEMSKQQSKTGSGGRGGIMGMVLPVYAVGIIGYLIYTLVKVYNKSSKGEYNKKPGYAKLKNKSPNTSEESSTIEEASLSELKESSAKLSELENLLSKADDKSISTDEMRALQTRLEETEKQMARILQAMQTVSSKMSNAAADTKEVKVESEEESKKGDSDQSSQKEEECNESDTKDTGVQKESGAREKEEKREEQKDEVILLDRQKGRDSEEESGVRQRKVLSEQNED